MVHNDESIQSDDIRKASRAAESKVRSALNRVGKLQDIDLVRATLAVLISGIFDVQPQLCFANEELWLQNVTRMCETESLSLSLSSVSSSSSPSSSSSSSSLSSSSSSSSLSV